MNFFFHVLLSHLYCFFCELSVPNLLICSESTTAKGTPDTRVPQPTLQLPVGRPARGGQILIRTKLGEHRMREGEGPVVRFQGFQGVGASWTYRQDATEWSLARTASSFLHQHPALLQMDMVSL